MLQIVLRSDEIFICVQNCPQFPEQRSTSLQQQRTVIQGRDGILADMKGMFDNVKNGEFIFISTQYNKFGFYCICSADKGSSVTGGYRYCNLL